MILLDLRIAHQLTQEQICKLTGIPYNTYRRYEYGEREPKWAPLSKLAKLYGMSPGELLNLLIGWNPPTELRKSRYQMDLKDKFEQEMWRIIKESEALGNNHSWSKQALSDPDIGPIKAAEIMVRSNDPSGLATLLLQNRLDLTTEYLIVKGGFEALFDEDVVKIAKERLGE